MSSEFKIGQKNTEDRYPMVGAASDCELASFFSPQRSQRTQGVYNAKMFNIGVGAGPRASPKGGWKLWVDFLKLKI